MAYIHEKMTADEKRDCKYSRTGLDILYIYVVNKGISPRKQAKRLPVKHLT